MSTVIARKPKRPRSFWIFYHGCKCKPLCDKTLDEDTLAERYERTMSRIEQITAAGYTVKVIWECEFDAAKIVEKKPELLTHPIDTVSYILEMPCTEVEPRPCIYTIRPRRTKKQFGIVT